MNITMIGMPSCGKSTIGVMLAKLAAMGFLDVDIMIQEKTGKKLKDIIAEAGQDGFLKVEGDIASSIDVQNTIIAPGGSICYEEEAMKHLKEISKIVYLKISCEDMEQRIGDVTDRGVAMPEGFTLRDLFDERAPLYEKYADVIIDEKGKTPAEIVREIKNWKEQIEKNI